MMAEYTEQFQQFWKVYPRKVAKVNALKAWIKQGCEGDLYMGQAAIDNVEKRTRLKWWSKDASKIPHPASWINAKRWEDEGWEGETEQGKRPARAPPRAAEWQPEELPPMCWEERVLGRLFVSYCVKAEGLHDVKPALTIKHDLMGDFVPDYREDIAAGDMSVDDADAVLAKVFVARLDQHYGLSLGTRVLAGYLGSGHD